MRIDQKETLVLSADGEHAVSGFNEGGQRRIFPRGWHAVVHPGGAIPFAEEVFAGDPEVAVAAWADSLDIGLIGRPIELLGSQDAAAENGGVAVACDPDRAVEGAGIADEFFAAARLRGGDGAILHAPQDTLIVDQPQVAGFIGGDAKNLASFPGGANFLGMEMTVFVVAGQFAGFVSDPESSFFVLKETGDAAAGQFRGVAAVKDGKAHAVKPGQAAIGAEPDVAVVGLDGGGNVVLRQAVFDQPVAGEVIGERGR